MPLYKINGYNDRGILYEGTMAQSHETPIIEVEVTKNGTTLKQYGGGPVSHFSKEAWQELVRNAKEGKYDLPK